MTDIATIEFFAIKDPSDPTRMTYWRLSARGLLSWPPAVVYQPTSGTLNTRIAGMSGVIAAIGVNPIAAAARFSVHKVRCTCCGRALTDASSRSFSVGPECRAGFPIDVLAALAEEVGRLHAARGDLVPMTFDLFQPQPEGAKA